MSERNLMPPYDPVICALSRSQIGEIRSDISEYVKPELKKVSEAIYGNGKPGLKEKIASQMTALQVQVAILMAGMSTIIGLLIYILQKVR